MSLARKIFVVLVLWFAFAWSASAQNQNLTVTSLVGTHIDTILKYHLMGEGVEISYGRFNNQQGVVQSNQIGTFQRNGFTSFPFETGLVMTTGTVTLAAGPNDQTGASSSTGVISYTDQQLATSGLPTSSLNNCAALDFNFLAYADTFCFNYVFGSEEYPSWVCSSFNDIFAFFLTGPDPVTGLVTTKNVAIIPGSVTAANPNGIPVTINSVNAGAGSNGSASTAGCYNGTYSMFYINNPSTPGVQYNGYTTQLAAEGRISACENYSMHLAVCNSGDNSYDSGVFLEEQSFHTTVETKLLMRDVYCLGEDINFTFTVDTVDSVYILTPHGDTLWSPYILPTAAVADSGWYVLNAHSALPCIDFWAKDSIYIQVLNLFKPDLGVDRYLCTGEIINLNANYSSSEDVNYIWSTGDTTESIMIVASGDYDLIVEVYNPATGTYCRSSDTVSVIYYPQAIANFESTATSGCAPLTIGFTGHCTPEDVLETRWSIFDENFNELYYSHEKDPVFEITQSGTFSVKLIITTYEGCVDSVILWNYITTSPQPIVDFASNPEISLWTESHGEITFTSFIAGNEDPNSRLVWNFGDGEELEAEPNPTHTYATWGDYIVTLSLTTDAGCMDTISHYVIIEDELIFPNIITPNGDGFNDVWAIGNLSTRINPEDPDKYRTNELHIYDRWGKQVYHAKNYDTYARNGEIFLGEKVFTGENLSDGVYYYSFYYKGKAKVVKYNGSLTIVR